MSVITTGLNNQFGSTSGSNSQQSQGQQLGNTAYAGQYGSNMTGTTGSAATSLVPGARPWYDEASNAQSQGYGNLWNQAAAGYDTLGQNVTSGMRGVLDAANQNVQSFGNTGRQDISDLYSQERARNTQGLASRGLGNTTIGSQFDIATGRAQAKDLTHLNEQVDQAKNQVLGQFASPIYQTEAQLGSQGLQARQSAGQNALNAQGQLMGQYGNMLERQNVSQSNQQQQQQGYQNYQQQNDQRYNNQTQGQQTGSQTGSTRTTGTQQNPFGGRGGQGGGPHYAPSYGQQMGRGPGGVGGGSLNRQPPGQGGGGRGSGGGGGGGTPGDTGPTSGGGSFGGGGFGDSSGGLSGFGGLTGGGFQPGGMDYPSPGMAGPNGMYGDAGSMTGGGFQPGMGGGQDWTSGVGGPDPVGPQPDQPIFNNSPDQYAPYDWGGSGGDYGPSMGGASGGADAGAAASQGYSYDPTNDEYVNDQGKTLSPKVFAVERSLMSGDSGGGDSSDYG